MATTLELTQEQVDRFSKFVEISNQIAILEQQAKEIRNEIEDVVLHSNVSDEETIMMFIDSDVIELSKPTKSLKFNYDVKDFINETKNYDVLAVSTTLARKHLTNEQLDVYFKIEQGKRKLSIK